MIPKIHYAKTLIPLCKYRGRDVRISDVLFKVNCTKCLLKVFPYTFVYQFQKEREINVLTVLNEKKEMIGTLNIIPSRGGFTTFLTELWVDPKYRRKGLATVMMRYIQSVEKPPIQLKSKAFIIGKEKRDLDFTQEKLDDFYKRLDFIPIVNSNNQMIWFPNELKKEQHVIYVENRVTHYIAFVKDQISIKGKGETYNGALGDLVQKYGKLLGVQLRDLG